jgi:hypothetical protein
VGIDDGWGDDPEYLAARIGAIVERMSTSWRGRSRADIEHELRLRLQQFGDDWPPELIEHLARRIGDPRWSWKHPWQALDLSRRYNARARTLPGHS